MKPESVDAFVEMRDVLLETYAVNDAMNQLLLAHLDAKAWRAKLPGEAGRGGRTIAAIFAHLHNARRVWLKENASHLRCPAALDPDRCTMKQAAAAHKKSAVQCVRMLTEALSGEPERKVKKFSRGAGRGRGLRGLRCLRTCFRTRRITGDRFCSWRICWGLDCLRRRGAASGSGTGCGSSRDLRSGRGDDCAERGKRKADSSLTAPKLRRVWGPVRSE